MFRRWAGNHRQRCVQSPVVNLTSVHRWQMRFELHSPYNMLYAGQRSHTTLVSSRRLIRFILCHPPVDGRQRQSNIFHESTIPLGVSFLMSQLALLTSPASCAIVVVEVVGWPYHFFHSSSEHPGCVAQECIMPPTYQPVGRRRLADEIVDQVEELIVKSELRVGDPLPPERDLARQLQVSRNALREAIGMLAQKGLVEVRPGTGSYVAQPTAAFIGDSLHFLLRLNANVLIDLMEARVVIESETAALAAQKATADALQGVKAALDEMDTHLAQPDEYTEADLTFHTELAQAAGNQVLLLFLLSLRAALRENIRYFARSQQENEKSLRFHHRIYEAVLARQPDIARQNMSAHFQPFIAYVRAGLASGSLERR